MTQLRSTYLFLQLLDVLETPSAPMLRVPLFGLLPDCRIAPASLSVCLLPDRGIAASFLS